jgi:hypothetical protein
MKTLLARCSCLVLVLAGATAVVEAQRGRRPPDPPSQPNSCAAAGVRCLLGSREGCSVTCPIGSTPYCSGGGCILGFPIAPECTCI